MVFIPEKVPTQTKVPVIKMIQNIVVLKESPNNIAVFQLKNVHPYCYRLVFSYIILVCRGPGFVSFVHNVYLCLYCITQFFPSKLGFRVPSKPRMSTTAPHFFVFTKKLQQRDAVEGRTLEYIVHLGSYGQVFMCSGLCECNFLCRFRSNHECYRGDLNPVR